MKLKKALLRWYKSFHLNYRGITEKGETISYRPWNKLSPPFAKDEDFPFIEIPIERDITTVVGANESGKSHLLNAITKAIYGRATDGLDVFKRTDLCHYAGIRTRNVEACPNIGLQFEFESDTEREAVSKIISGESHITSLRNAPTFTFIIEPTDGEAKAATGHLFVEPNEQQFALSPEGLETLRALLPTVQFIDSKALLASEIPLAQLIAICADPPNPKAIGFLNRKSVETAAEKIMNVAAPTAEQPVPVGYAESLNSAKAEINKASFPFPGVNCLEKRLFKEILEITPATLRYIYALPLTDRGYIEGQMTKWNDEIDEKLNLAHFWRQDEQFSLTVNYKDGIIYFEIHDKTGSIYTFKERSSGLKFFLSYYIQAKALEITRKNHNSIILMDEPDSALSIIGQRNLLAVFESLVSPESSNQTCQLIYTTHSPYLINRNFPRRIRVVKKEDAEEGTQYIEQARARRYEPVRTALGIDSAPSLFLGADNILLEGATDQYLITEMIRVFATPANVGNFLDLNAVVVVSADGVGNVRNVLEQSHWLDEPIPPTAVLLDSDAQALSVVETITAAVAGRDPVIAREFVSTLAELVSAFGLNQVILTTEDIVPAPIYKLAIRAYFERWLPETHRTSIADITDDLAAPEFGQAGLVEATKALFKKYKPEFQGDYDKMGVFQEVVAIALARVLEFETNSETQQVTQLDEDMRSLKANIIKLCDFIRDALSKSRSATTKFSTTQAIKRIINDFKRLNKLNVPITALQKLFRRLESEVSSIGTEADGFLHIVNSYLAELDRLRTAGQERIAGDQWKEWEARIAAIRRNPLTASNTVTSTVVTPAEIARPNPVVAAEQERPAPQPPLTEPPVDETKTES